MDFFRKLFGGSQPAQGEAGDRAGLYFYVRPAGCQEVVRVRIDRNNDISLGDDGGYFAFKTVRGSSYKCTRSAELRLYFDAQRRLQNAEVVGGDLVTQEDYEAWLASEQQT
jgi:hypothetical protein